ncbi:DUF3320 domain-containing protein [Amorphus sp. MBR-141]
MPDFEAMPGETAEEKPTTPAGRVNRWQRKLLDLSLRNRLLNFTLSKSTVPFLCPDPAYLEDRLAEGIGIRIVSLPEQNPLGERDPALFRETRGQDIQRQFAADALKRDELASPLDAKALEGGLTTLYRQAKSDLAEGGTNTLYIAVGFLRWKKKPEDDRTYRAPLLLVPTRLDRRSASSQFRLLHHEDDVRFNATLLQFLKRDFDLDVPSLQNDLPTDDSGIDVPLVLERMRQAVRDVPGFEVVDETALGTFSFAKFLMWKDLTERTDALRQNRVVRHLIDTPDQAFTSDSAVFRDEREVDTLYSPAEIVTPLPADSSQVVASLAAAEGKDFVVIGPPGTGKSQTIANMIANCLASRKTVLFVAEKTAALDVVYRRLREHGLGDHCLELHSNKADRRRFLGQLKDAWEKGGKDSRSEWVELNDRLKVRRDQLNAYVEALHYSSPNGLTPFAAMGIALRAKDRHAPALTWPSKDAHDRPSFLNLQGLAQELGLTFAAVEVRPVLNSIDVSEWSSIWQEQLLAAGREYSQAASQLAAALSELRPQIGLPSITDANRRELACYVAIAAHLEEHAEGDFSVIFDETFDRIRSSLDAFQTTLQDYASNEGSLSGQYDRGEVQRVPVEQLDREWREATSSMWPLSWLRSRKCRKLLQSYARAGRAHPQIDLPLLRAMQASASAADGSPLSAVPHYFDGVNTDTQRLRDHLTAAAHLREALFELVDFGNDAEAIARAVEPVLSGAESRPIRRSAEAYLRAYRHFLEAETTFSGIAGTAPEIDQARGGLSAVAELASELENCRSLLRNWSSWCSVRNRATAYGLGPLIRDLETGAIVANDAREALLLGYVRWWLPLAIDDDATLRDFRRFQHEHAIGEFRDIDDLVRKAASARVRSAVEHDLPSPQSVPRKSELGLLRHQMELKRPSRSIREMIGGMPESFAKLAPCVLMSPLSIAQYLPPEQALFDVVIFDEASQITTWDAVGAVARGRQTIIVGDPKQLPPTNFFGRNEEESGEVEEYEKDLESILDEAKASGLPVHDLRWHYRSRHESLIAFSNWNYYENRLITFPSPVTEDRAVSFRHVPNAVYDRGKSRTNKEEARAISREVAGRLKRWLALPERERPTIGVITFNTQQQSLIQDFLDEERRANQDLEWFFADERIEPVFVKNLENVQGDERDVILFSITFCKDHAGKLSVSFGAINHDGGERRLNVAVTRARQELVVFAGITADQIDLSRTKATGVHHLKTFLDYAERGPVALPAQDAGSQGELESPFEEAIAEALRNRGWHLVPQVGVSGFRVDIGVKHPDRAGAFLAGVECDGATYHRSATARDRDKVREQVLRGLGWNILRVWSTDWWFDSAGAATRLHDALEALLEESRNHAEPTPSEEEPIHWEMNETEGETREAQEQADLPPRTSSGTSEPEDPEPREDMFGDHFAEDGSTFVHTDQKLDGQTGQLYRVTDLSRFPADADRFYAASYRQTLQEMVDAVLEAEAPVREDILMQRIARAHGWLRTGKRIRERIEQHVHGAERTETGDSPFLWNGPPQDRFPYRKPAGPEHRRNIPEISLAELTDFALQKPEIFDEDDPPLVMARLLGVDRLSASSRERLRKVQEAASQTRNRAG